MYYLCYRFKDSEYTDVLTAEGSISKILEDLKGKIHKIEEFQLYEKETMQTIARSRGDAIIIYDNVPTTFNYFIKEFRVRKGRKEPVMALSKKKAEEPKKTEDAQALVIEVLRAKDFSEEGKEGCSISVDLKINGVTIYGCWYREGKDKKGEDYQMVSFPSHQGKDKKYYNYAYVKLQQSDVDFICKEIEKLL